jgi:predicted RNase H-like HicB family nuclease
MYVYEFEFFQGDRFVIARPFDLEHHVTQGKDLDEAIEMAADLLRVIAEDSLMHGSSLPNSTFGHEPEHGGKVMAIGISASLDEIRAIKASEAAERLGLSRGRVSNMLRAGILEGFRKGRDSYVTLDSLEARLASSPSRKGGRPRKVPLEA